VKQVILFLAIVLLSACSDLKRPEQLEKIQQLSSELESVQEVSNNFTQENISLTISKLSEVENRMKENFQDDTLNIELIKQLDSYKRIGPALTFVVNANRTIDSSIELRKSKLDNLLSDIENSVGNRAKYDDYIQIETEEIEELKSFVNYCDSATRQSFKTFNNLHPDLEKFSLKLKMKNDLMF